MGTIETGIIALSWIFVITVALPFVRNDYWVFRIFEYPRSQKLILCLAVFVAALVIVPLDGVSFATITLSLLFLCICYLAYKIFPYTRLQKKEMLSVASQDAAKQIKVFTANVYQENTDYQRMLQQVQSTDPDVVFLLETDRNWEQAMDELKKTHPHTLKEPLDNTYGLLFYSRCKIVEGKVQYLVANDIPSVEAILELKSGDHVKVFGLHPKPPVPNEDDTSTDKDRELIQIAYKAKACKLPVMVMGDLNDVAWSKVTELFRKISGLLDPRRGRGFYSTFSAFSWFFRFPLDYIFCSSHFGLIRMKRLPKNGSDHFAMFSQFELVPALQSVQDEPEADASEHQEASKKLAG